MAGKGTVGAEPTAAIPQTAPAVPIVLAEPASATDKPARLMSLDALRGFDMLWIIGADEIVDALAKISHGGILAFFAYQLTHAQWEGFRFYDLIFPLFLFMVGISTVFSLDKSLAQDGRAAAYRRIFRRFLLLWFWAFIYSGGFDREQVSFAGVLQRIAYCYLVVSLLYIHLRPKALLAVCVAILAGYWALLTFVPVPELGRPTFDMHVNWANYLDRHYLPGDREERGWRNEGMLSTIPAVATCLLGVFTALFLKDDNRSPRRKVALLFIAGCVLAALGYLWGIQLPIIKRIWTSSYVLVAGGYSLMFLAAFYLLIDVWQYRRGSTPFVWLGANALVLYLVAGLIPHEPITQTLVGGDIAAFLGPYAPIARTAVALALLLLLARFLYNRRIFLRV